MGPTCKQVPRNANADAIKRSYYRLARMWHPDKCPSDPLAKERFQLLGEAYQVSMAPPGFSLRHSDCQSVMVWPA